MKKKIAFLIIGKPIEEYPYTLHLAVCRERKTAEILMDRLALLDDFNREFDAAEASSL